MGDPMMITFVVSVALAVLVGAGGMWRLRQRPAIDALIALATPVGVVLVGWVFYVELADNIGWSWNDIRLTPSFYVVNGVEVYNPPNEGPMLGWVYGPMTIYAYTPATLAPTPTAALTTAIALSGLITSLSVWWLMQTMARNTTERFVMTLAAVGFVVWALEHPQSKYAMANVTADAPALALGVSACALLMMARRIRRRDDQTRRHTALWVGAAACAALATWAKQIEAPIVLALPLFVLIDEGWRRAVRFGLIELGVGVTVSLVMIAPFSWRGLWFNMFELTGATGYRTWQYPGMSPFAEAALLLWLVTWVWLVLLIACAIVGWGALRGRVRRPTAWFRRHAATLPTIAAVLLIPMSILGMAKVGGFYNSMHTAFYLQAAAWMAIGSLAIARRSPRLSTVVKTMLLITLGWKLATALPSLDKLPGAAELADNATAQAVDFAEAHPGEVYYPYHPLATWWAESAVYHNGYALFDRVSSGLPPDTAHLRAHLPPEMRYIARHTPVEDTELELLSEFDRRIRLLELPDWDVYVRSDPPRVDAPGRD